MTAEGGSGMERAALQAVLDCIEEYLREEIGNSFLAEAAGYSEYHFLRAFRAAVGLTPADYIRKRRISEIVRRIGLDDRPMSEIAFEFGFNSKENFTRAFKREHGILPTRFRAANCSLRLFAPYSTDAHGMAPAVSLVHMAPFAVFAYPSDEAIATSFWNRYNAGGWSARLTGGKVVMDYGVMRYDREKGGLDYYIGVKEEDAKGDLTGAVRLEIAGGLYAAFDTPQATRDDFVSTIHRTWNWIADTWLPESGYRRAPGFEFECYTETSRTYTERIFIPLKGERDNG